MFNKVSYRRGVIEGVVLYTLGRLGALITPAFFPGWLFVVAPLLFLALQFLAGPLWATQRIQSTRRERLSKRHGMLKLVQDPAALTLVTTGNHRHLVVLLDSDPLISPGFNHFK